MALAKNMYTFCCVFLQCKNGGKIIAQRMMESFRRNGATVYQIMTFKSMIFTKQLLLHLYHFES